LVSQRIVQSKIADALGITEKTLIKMKQLHPRINQAFVNGDTELESKLVDAVYQRAIGMEYEEIQTIIEETKTGTKKKIIKTKKKSLPDFNAAKYLLAIKFGRKYNEKKEIIALMEKRIAKDDDVWFNEALSDELPDKDESVEKATMIRSQKSKVM
jgi:CRISPR/Cas system CSM-associated protein Csm2 small subunit